MMRQVRRWLVVAVAVVAILSLTSSAHAQVRRLGPARVLPNSQAIVNPYYRVAPNLPLNQYAYNVRTIGRAYSQVPPWVYGYNPYPSPIYNYGPVYSTPYSYAPGYSYSPLTTNFSTIPTIPTVPAPYLSNPLYYSYMNNAVYNPYVGNPFYSPYLP